MSEFSGQNKNLSSTSMKAISVYTANSMIIVNHISPTTKHQCTLSWGLLSLQLKKFFTVVDNTTLTTNLPLCWIVYIHFN